MSASGNDPLTTALARLNRALDTLSDAIDTATDRSQAARNAEEAIQVMSEDRSALARSLDESEARARRLSEVNADVSRRLVGAMETVRGVLETQK